MAQKTIPELNEINTIDEFALIPIDTGTQSFKMPSIDLAKSLLPLSRPNPVAAKVANYTILPSDAFQILRVNSVAGSFNLSLPDPANFAKLVITILDIGGKLSDNPITLVRNGTEEIGGLASDYLLEADYGSWNLYCDGVDWFLI